MERTHAVPSVRALCEPFDAERTACRRSGCRKEYAFKRRVTTWRIGRETAWDSSCATGTRVHVVSQHHFFSQKAAENSPGVNRVHDVRNAVTCLVMLADAREHIRDR